MKYLLLLGLFTSFAPYSSSRAHEVEYLKIQILIKKQNGTLDIDKIKTFIDERECKIQ